MSVDDRLRLAFAGMHPDRRAELVEKLGSPSAVVRAIEAGTVDVPDHARAAVRVPATQRRSQLGALRIEPLLREDAAFPPHLAALPGAPDLLFVRGTVPVDPCVAVVGTRRASRYGLGLARSFGFALARAGWPVASGLARGIDAAAHWGVTDAGGVGLAVLGCGPDIWYPPEHRRLGSLLLETGGAVISEYPPGAPPLGWRFPPRNRIISGLAAVVVVVEAGRSGGALITARTAAEQGREVFAVPGDVDRATSEGCNLLIRDGAVPVLGAADLIEAASLVLGPPPASAAPTDPDTNPLVEALGPVGRPVDGLASMLGIPVPEVLRAVARLEAEGRVSFSNGVVSPVASTT